VAGLFRNVHFYVRRAPFKLTAAIYIEHYSKPLFLVIGLKNPCLSFLRFRSFIDSQFQTHRHLDRGKAGSKIQGAPLRSLKLNAGEPKGRDVSDGLIGSDTIGKLSGLLHVFFFYHLQRERKCRGRQGEVGREEKKKNPTKKNYLMIETFSILFLLTENFTEK